MKSSKFKLSLAAATVAALFGSSAFAQATTNSVTPVVTGGTNNSAQFSVGFAPATGSTTTPPSQALLPAPVVMNAVGTLNTVGLAVPPLTTGAAFRRIVRTADLASTTTSTGASTSGVNAFANGDVTLTAGSAASSVGTTNFGTFVYQDINTNGSVASDGSFYAQFTGTDVNLATAQRAPIGATPQAYISGTGPYTTVTAVITPQVAQPATSTGGNLIVGGNARVVGTTTLGAVTAGAVTAASVTAGLGGITTTGAINGGAITGTSLSLGATPATAGAITAGAINAASINTTGNVVAGNVVAGNVFVGTAVEGNQVVTKSQSNAAIAAAFAPMGGQISTLNNKVEQNDKRASSGIAGALAVANIPAVEAGKTGSFGVGLGNYNGQTSVAAGVTYRINQMQLKGSVSGGSGGKVGVGVGAGFGF